MSFVVKKRDLTDPAQLRALIVEHADDLERGLTILDSRLMLGQASIDIVGLDADGSLVLIAVGLVADEEMFMKAVDAYSWCLEYPEAIHRLYPTVQFSAARPPRVMFVVERMPDAFHRKIKQLGFPEVDCVEFRHLDVDGTPAMYFDSLARLRRSAMPAPPAPEQNGVPPSPVGRPTSLKLQKLLGADRAAAAREPAAVVRIVPRATSRPEPKPVASAPRPERSAPRKHVDEPVAPTAQFTADAPAPPAARVTTAAPVVETIRTVSAPPSSSWETAAVPTVADVPHLLAPDGETADAVVEPFVLSAHPTENGRVDVLATPLREPEPEHTPAASIAPNALVPPIAAEVLEVERSEPMVEPVTPEPPIADDAMAPVATDSEPDMVAAALTAPEPRFDVPLVLELESGPIVKDVPAPAVESLQPLVLEREAAMTEVGAEAAPLTIESVEPIAIEQEPTVADLSIEPLRIADEPEPVVAQESISTPEPIVPPAAPSVFSRRPPEAPTVNGTVRKVSFAGMAKDLLSNPTPPPAAEPPVSVPRSSVEEITRAALNDLVGANDKRSTEDRPAAFSKPGAFAKSPAQKRPRTIAPPPSDGQPIAGGTKLGMAPRGIGTPANGTDSATPASEAETERPQAVEGFEGLQFPNDGVLTRQWMEFLNQMAAGK